MDIEKNISGAKTCYATVKANFIYILFAAAFLALAAVQVQKYLDRRAVEIQTEKLNRFDQSLRESKEQSATLLEMFYKQQKSTESILETTKAMSGTISLLVENDRQFSFKVNNLKEEYQNAKTPYKKGAASRGAPVKYNRPLRQREEDILTNDRKLYGNSSPSK